MNERYILHDIRECQSRVGEIWIDNNIAYNVLFVDARLNALGDNDDSLTDFLARCSSSFLSWLACDKCISSMLPSLVSQYPGLSSRIRSHSLGGPLIDDKLVKDLLLLAKELKEKYRMDSVKRISRIRRGFSRGIYRGSFPQTLAKSSFSPLPSASFSSLASRSFRGSREEATVSELLEAIPPGVEFPTYDPVVGCLGRHWVSWVKIASYP